ncbi:hypothetical protein SB748_25720 [Rhizobium sp. SIMBA_035]
MEEKINIISNAGIEEREEIVLDIARWLETTAQEALIFDEGRFAKLSTTISEAMRATTPTKAAYPHRVIS